MAEATIAVDLFNPGQVFACLGFLEAADVLLGDAEGGFDWNEAANVRFRLKAAGESHPVAVVLEFLANATPHRIAPVGYVAPPLKRKANDLGDDDDEDSFDEPDDAEPLTVAASPLAFSETFPAASGDAMSLPIRLHVDGNPTITLGHWADGTGRATFKLYSGNRTAERITRAMLLGTREKKKKDKKTKQMQPIGDIKTRGVAHLWQEHRDALIEKPFDVLSPLGGSFNFDPRGGWTAINAGYSPNKQKHTVAASPVVHILAALGLEHARPFEFGLRQVRYAAWGEMLTPMLARVALQGRPKWLRLKCFRFELALNGKNKIVTFSQLETTHD